jgi:hypothetical protein
MSCMQALVNHEHGATFAKGPAAPYPGIGGGALRTTTLLQKLDAAIASFLQILNASSAHIQRRL